jgi:hypothetical protein
MNQLGKKIKKKIKMLLEKALEYVKDTDDYNKLVETTEKTNTQLKELDNFCVILEKKRDDANDIIKKWSVHLKKVIKQDKQEAKSILKKIHIMRARRDGLTVKIDNITQIAFTIKETSEMKEYHDLLLHSTNTLKSETNKIDIEQLDNDSLDLQENIKEIERFSAVTNENLNVLTDDSELEKELENLESQMLDEKFVDNLLKEPIKSSSSSIKHTKEKEKEKEKEKRIVTIQEDNQSNHSKNRIEIKVGEHNKKLDDFNEIFEKNEIQIEVEKKNKVLN